MSRPSTPSDSSVLALHARDFAYNTDVHLVEYPLDHDQSEPSTPLSSRTPRRSNARAYSLSSIDRSSAPPQARRIEESVTGQEEEYARAHVARGRAADEHMDPFTLGEITVMASSSFMVLGLIVIAATLAVGKFKL